MATFPDLGLQLAVINRLLEMELVSPDEIRAYLAPAAESLRDDDSDEQQKIEGALNLLANFPLQPEHLAQVTMLDFDGGNSIYLLIEEIMGVYTGGESDYYLAQDFEGVEQLPALEEVNLVAYAVDADTERLKDHPNSPMIED